MVGRRRWDGGARLAVARGHECGEFDAGYHYAADLKSFARNYVDDRMTKDSLRRVVHLEDPGLIGKSGQCYWLNDWRGKQQEADARFTYTDLAEHLRGLMRTDGRLPQISSARMSNFITDFQGDPVISAWMWLKRQPGPIPTSRINVSVVLKS